MGLRINSHIASLLPKRKLAETTKAFQRSLERLSSGKRINSARDDAAGLVLGTRLMPKSEGCADIRNMNEAYGMIQIADGTLAVQADLVQRMRELAMQASNGTLSDSDRDSLNSELQQLVEEFNRITNQTTFNGTKLLDGSFETTALQVGAETGQTVDFTIASMQASEVFTQQIIVGTGTFEARSAVQSGSNPYSVATGDLNQDGVLDLIITDYNDATASIALGNGNGSFKARTTIEAGTQPISVTTGDLNQDGALDLIVSNRGSDTASIALGNGNGTFNAPATIQTGSSPRSVTVGDLNRDGALDVIIADYNSATASIAFGNGNGTFEARTTIQTGSNPYSVATGDLNQDGALDLIVADRGSNTASIALGNGNGTFKARTTIQTGSLPISVATGDLNQDGALDLITADYTSNTASIALGNGNGTFKARTTIQTGSLPNSVTMGDLNQDGALDLITADYSSSTASIVFGNGNGTFKVRTTIQTGSLPMSVTMGDLNQDGALDLITADYNGDTASVFLAITEIRNVIPALDISTQASAQELLEVFDNALDYISASRASIGALQSRLDFAESTAQVMVENLTQSRSQILDTDYTQETAEFARLQILQQAEIAVLGQANLSLQMVLQLLKGGAF